MRRRSFNRGRVRRGVRGRRRSYRGRRQRYVTLSRGGLRI